jgi:hypothetical protein
MLIIKWRIVADAESSTEGQQTQQAATLAVACHLVIAHVFALHVMSHCWAVDPCLSAVCLRL